MSCMLLAVALSPVSAVAICPAFEYFATGVGWLGRWNMIVRGSGKRYPDITSDAPAQSTMLWLSVVPINSGCWVTRRLRLINGCTNTGTH